MTTFTKRIAAGGDDWHTINGTGFDSTGINADWGNFGGNWIDGGFRFTNVTIPQRATIFDAKLTFESNSDRSGTIASQIHCVDADNAAAPTSQAEHAALSRTAAYSSWATPNWSDGASYDSPDFASAVQEVINRGGWSSGNALTVLMDDAGSGTNIWRIASTYNDTPSTAALLTVTYTTDPQAVIFGAVLGLHAPTVETYDTRFKMRARARDTALGTRVRNE